MITDYPTAVVFGGTGFVGTQVVRELAARGYRVKVATRVPESAYSLRTCGVVGQVVPFACDYSEGSIAKAVRGCDAAVNCTGILYQRGKRCTFQRVHVGLPEMIAQACAKEKVARFVHVSALSSQLVVSVHGSKYARSKVQGEKAVLAAFPQAVILRPSVIFGEDDSFFNKFARLVRVLPSFVPLPLIGGGHTRFQPVFVGDVADAVMAGIESPQTSGKIYELGGPEIVTFQQIYEILFEQIHMKQPLIEVPFYLAKVQGFFMSMLPNPMLTPDQVESLKSDSVVDKEALNFKDLGIVPRSMDLVLPTYLEYYRPGGRFGNAAA